MPKNQKRKISGGSNNKLALQQLYMALMSSNTLSTDYESQTWQKADFILTLKQLKVLGNMITRSKTFSLFIKFG